jgi:hypothetical protein
MSSNSITSFLGITTKFITILQPKKTFPHTKTTLRKKTPQKTNTNNESPTMKQNDIHEEKAKPFNQSRQKIIFFIRIEKSPFSQ